VAKKSRGQKKSDIPNLRSGLPLIKKKRLQWAGMEGSGRAPIQSETGIKTSNPLNSYRSPLLELNQTYQADKVSLWKKG